MLCLSVLNITQTRPCNIHQYFTGVKMIIFLGEKSKYFSLLFSSNIY